MFSPARHTCNAINAHALVCRPHATQSTLLSRKTQKPTLRFDFSRDATSQAATT